MLAGSVAVKKTALAVLKGRWPLGAAAVGIPMALVLIMLNLFALIEYMLAKTVWLAAAYVLLLLCAFTVLFPLMLGTLRVLWGIATDREVSVSDTFFYLSSKEKYLKAMNFIVVLCGSVIAKAIALFSPAIIVYLASELLPSVITNHDARLWLDNLWIFTLFLSIIALCGTVYVILRYYLAPFLFICSAADDAVDTVMLAKSVSRVSLGHFVSLLFGLLGWILLSVFFVPLIFTAPYILTCYLFHSRFAAVFYNASVKKYKSEGGAI